jgi:hypothetical protein
VAQRYPSHRDWQLAVDNEVFARLNELPASARQGDNVRKITAQVQRDMASRKPEAAKLAAKPRTPKKRGT